VARRRLVTASEEMTHWTTPPRSGTIFRTWRWSARPPSWAWGGPLTGPCKSTETHRSRCACRLSRADGPAGNLDVPGPRGLPGQGTASADEKSAVDTRDREEQQIWGRGKSTRGRKLDHLRLSLDRLRGARLRRRARGRFGAGCCGRSRTPMAVKKTARRGGCPIMAGARGQRALWQASAARL